MSVQGYILRFKLNAARSTMFKTSEEGAYYHMIELTLFIKDQTKSFIPYEEIETKVRNYLNNYSGKLLNDVPPFDRLEPTLENIARYFFDQLKIILYSIDFILYQLEIREKSTRIFSIYEQISMGKRSNQRIRKLKTLIAENQNQKDANVKGGR